MIVVSNPEFDGYRYGIKFHEGRAVVHSSEVRDVLVRDFGYREVAEVEDKE